MKRAAITVFLLLSAINACADDAPAFDRPGIAFAPSTVPRGGVALELGVPDFSHDASGGVDSRQFGFGAVARTGLTANLELQLGSALFNHLDQRDETGRRHENGYGDTNIGLKYALPSPNDHFTWAALGSVSFPTGARAFSGGTAQYDFGVTGKYDFSERISGVLYGNYTHVAGGNAYTVSPSAVVTLTKTIGLFVEAGFGFQRGQPDTVVAGGGLTWMVTPTVQLDAFTDFGANSSTPDVQAGFGVSIYFD